MMARQTISIIIPVRNQAKTLGPLLDSRLRLKVPAGWEKEIIAAYTESTDDTLAVLQQKKIDVVQSTEIGPGPARNVAESSGRKDWPWLSGGYGCPHFLSSSGLNRSKCPAKRSKWPDLGRFAADP